MPELMQCLLRLDIRLCIPQGRDPLVRQEVVLIPFYSKMTPKDAKEKVSLHTASRGRIRRKLRLPATRTDGRAW